MTDSNEDTPTLVPAFVNDVIADDALLASQVRTNIVMFRETETESRTIAAVLDVRAMAGGQQMIELQIVMSDKLARHLAETWVTQLDAAAKADLPE